MEVSGLSPFADAQPPLSEGQGFIKSIGSSLFALAAVKFTIKCIIYLIAGRWFDLAGFWFPTNLTLAQTFVQIWLLSPLIDLAETVSRSPCYGNYPRTKLAEINTGSGRVYHTRLLVAGGARTAWPDSGASTLGARDPSKLWHDAVVGWDVFGGPRIGSFEDIPRAYREDCDFVGVGQRDGFDYTTNSDVFRQ